MKVLPAAFVIALLAGAAQAQDAPMPTAGASGSPPAAEAAPAPAIPVASAARDPNSPEAIGAWARGVLAGETARDPDMGERAEAAQRCPQPADRKPHGEVWAGIGTRGYRNVGMVATQPVGKCGQVTVAIEHTEANYGHRGRGRR